MTKMNNGTIEVINLSDDSDCEGDVLVVSSSDDGGIESDSKNHNNSSIIIQDEQSPSNDRVIQNDSAPTLDASLEDFDYNLKLMRYGNFEQYKTTCCTKLSTALKDLISDLAKSGKSLILTRREEIEPLPLDATPQMLNFDSGTILNAIVVNQQQHQSKNSSSTTKLAHNPNVITLKLQDGQMRHLKEYQIAKQEPLRLLKEKYAREFNIEPDRMKLCFDGDQVDDEETPEDLDIEDECVIDVVVDT